VDFSGQLFATDDLKIKKLGCRGPCVERDVEQAKHTGTGRRDENEIIQKGGW